jgi:hypothetical protein
LTLENSYLPLTLASHLGLALVTLGIAGYATVITGRRHQTFSKAAAGIAADAALGATIAGAVFLQGGASNVALYAMEAFAVAGILAAARGLLSADPRGGRAPTGAPS